MAMEVGALISSEEVVTRKMPAIAILAPMALAVLAALEEAMASYATVITSAVIQGVEVQTRRHRLTDPSILTLVGETGI